MHNILLSTAFRVILAPGVKLPKAPLELHPLSWYWDVTTPTCLTVAVMVKNAERVEAWLRSLPSVLAIERAEESSALGLEA